MVVISILGDVGSGKTLLSTYFALTDNRPIYANYKIKMPSWHDLKPETLFTVRGGALVILDESYTWIESRLSGRPINIFTSYVMFQSRKREIDIIMTNQIARVIDARFRDMTNIEINCFAVPGGFEYLVFRNTRFGMMHQETFFMPFEIAKIIYPYYDTWEEVDAVDSELLFKVSKDKSGMVEKIDAHVVEILKSVPVEKLTRGFVSDYCLRAGLAKGFIGLIYDAAKASPLRKVR